MGGPVEISWTGNALWRPSLRERDKWKPVAVGSSFVALTRSENDAAGCSYR